MHLVEEITEDNIMPFQSIIGGRNGRLSSVLEEDLVEELNQSLQKPSKGKMGLHFLSPKSVVPSTVDIPSPATAITTSLVVSPKKSSTKNSSRKVTMNSSVHYREIRHINEFSQEEIKALWISPEEQQESKKAYTVIVRAMMRSATPLEETDDVCTRGLGMLLV